MVLLLMLLLLIAAGLACAAAGAAARTARISDAAAVRWLAALVTPTKTTVVRPRVRNIEAYCVTHRRGGVLLFMLSTLGRIGVCIPGQLISILEREVRLAAAVLSLVFAP